MSKCEKCNTERVYRRTLNGGETVVCPKCNPKLAEMLRNQDLTPKEETCATT